MTVALCVSKGLAGAPWIKAAYPQVERIIELPERLDYQGAVHYELDQESALVQLHEAREQGVQQLYLALAYAQHYPQHEDQVVALAQWLGLDVVQRSHLTHDPLAYLERQYPLLVERCFVSKQGLELHLRWLENTELAVSAALAKRLHFVLNAQGKLVLPPFAKRLHFQPEDLLGVLLN